MLNFCKLVARESDCGHGDSGEYGLTFVGMNVFVPRAVLPDVSTGTILCGVTPFWMAGMFRALLVLLSPAIVLILPQLLY